MAASVVESEWDGFEAVMVPADVEAPVRAAARLAFLCGFSAGCAAVINEGGDLDMSLAEECRRAALPRKRKRR